jgi:hypothetical protein
MLELGGCLLEPFVGDEGFVPLLRLDPFLVGTPDDGAFPELGLSKVEAVPVEPAYVDRVRSPHHRKVPHESDWVTTDVRHATDPRIKRAQNRTRAPQW